MPSKTRWLENKVAKVRHWQPLNLRSKYFCSIWILWTLLFLQDVADFKEISGVLRYTGMLLILELVEPIFFSFLSLFAQNKQQNKSQVTQQTYAKLECKTAWLSWFQSVKLGDL